MRNVAAANTAASFFTRRSGSKVAEVAKMADEQIKEYIEEGYPVEALRLWTAGTKAADMTALVDISAEKDGRGYTLR